MRTFFEMDIADEQLGFAVIAAVKDGKWLFCEHKSRSTWEFPGGHREQGESIDDTAARELYEETGAKAALLVPVCAYGVERDGEKSYGMLFLADVATMDALPEEFEMQRVELCDEIPGAWTYPQIQPLLLQKAEDKLRELGRPIPGTHKEALIRNFLEVPLKPEAIHGGQGLCPHACVIRAEELDTPLRFVNYTVLPPQASFGDHVHGDDNELYIVLEGEGVYTVNGKASPVKTGDILVNPRFATHAIENTGKTDMRLLVMEVYNA